MIIRTQKSFTSHYVSSPFSPASFSSASSPFSRRSFHRSKSSFISTQINEMTRLANGSIILFLTLVLLSGTPYGKKLPNDNSFGVVLASAQATPTNPSSSLPSSSFFSSLLKLRPTKDKSTASCPLDVSSWIQSNVVPKYAAQEICGTGSLASCSACLCLIGGVAFDAAKGDLSYAEAGHMAIAVAASDSKGRRVLPIPEEFESADNYFGCQPVMNDVLSRLIDVDVSSLPIFNEAKDSLGTDGHSCLTDASLREAQSCIKANAESVEREASASRRLEGLVDTEDTSSPSPTSSSSTPGTKLYVSMPLPTASLNYDGVVRTSSGSSGQVTSSATSRGGSVPLLSMGMHTLATTIVVLVALLYLF